MAPTPEALLAVLADDLRLRPGDGYVVQIIHERPWSLVFTIDGANHSKIATRWRPDDFYRESDVVLQYAKWRNLGVPVPDVLAVGSAFDGEYLVSSFVEGVNGADLGLDSAARQNLLHGLGANMAAMHTLHAPMHGFLASDRPVGWEGILPSLLNDNFASTVHVLQIQQLLSSSQEAKLISIADALETLTHRTSPTLLHGDLAPQNAIADAGTGELRAILDPVPIGGDPMYDLAVVRHFLRREHSKGNPPVSAPEPDIRDWRRFATGYESRRRKPLERTELSRVAHWEALIFARKLLFLCWHDQFNERQDVLRLLVGRIDAIQVE